MVGGTPELRAFYEQRLDWHPCADDAGTENDDFRCTTLRVPLDYANPTGRTIDLAMAMLPASEKDERIGALVTNPGPGASGVQWLFGAADSFAGTLHARFDVVAFDPRGVGASSPVRCLDDAARDARNTADGPTADSERAAYKDRLDREFAAGCRQKSGDLLPFIGTRDTARDMDVLRGALGQAKLDYLGLSYGTYLGTRYVEQFPDRAGRIVLDGAVDPAQDRLSASVEQAVGFDIALSHFAKDCTHYADCPLGNDPDKAPSAAADFLDGLRDAPLPTHTPGRQLTANLGWSGTIGMLYGDATTWQPLRDALTAAIRDHDGTDLLSFADQFNGRAEDGRYDNSADAFEAISCADSPGDTPSAERVQQALDELGEDAPLYARGTTAAELARQDCALWPSRANEPPHPVKAPPGTPVLVIGNFGDPVTPPAAAKRLAEQLGNAVRISLLRGGHTAFGTGSSCIDRAVATYLIHGTVSAELVQKGCI
ncbi:alpha/beta hydrolase [Yinghuangia seranimata]|uniref:alpha/beta hydrolase n=1 Tax=Yinghuangia seranimata TaxID=408067 RepID=UPI00248B5EEA|nr:alpha/beta hydrolase [Yinghuangia seranimata]MDI2130546.1 alpha/beta hydrolase [Yinghuangia seranimata]